ncbi:DUF4129 domain-containing protein [Nocardioides cynanchi]|uniref:DUF4129 domain-containing protein n=1 Tax=Nocardioides cynanchi TaxID=2558918 RepID=UPI00124781EC|nr:DUF4129 domain-containing protein [Nocardioides cynanchi]
MSARRAGALALGFSLAGVVLMLLLVVMAARSGPSGVIHGTPRDDIFHPPRPTITSQPGHRSGPDSTTVLPQGTSSVPFASVLGTVVRYALFAWLLLLAYRGLRWLVDDLAARRSTEPRAAVIDFDVLEDPAPLVDEMRRDAADQFALLLGGTPRNAIVAAWDRFEEQAERVGAARKLWETSSEFTLRLLDAVSAAPVAVTRLAALYREARFSEHEITEGNREAAAEALRDIHASIGIPAGVGR